MQEKIQVNEPFHNSYYIKYINNFNAYFVFHCIAFSHYYLVNTKAGLLLKKEELRRSGDVGVRRRRLRDRKQRERKNIKKYCTTFSVHLIIMSRWYLKEFK